MSILKKFENLKIASVTIPDGSFELHSIEVRIDMVRPFLRAFRTFVDANAILVRRERQAETKLSALSRDDSEFSKIHWRSGTRVVPLSQRASTFVNLAKLWKYENLRIIRIPLRTNYQDGLRPGSYPIWT